MPKSIGWKGKRLKCILQHEEDGTLNYDREEEEQQMRMNAMKVTGTVSGQNRN